MRTQRIGSSVASEAHLLDNFCWQALAGPQERFSVGTSSARRLAPGFAPLIGFASAQQPDLQALARYCLAGERLHSVGRDIAAPPGWRIESQSTLSRMVWDAPFPRDGGRVEPVRIGPEHLPQVLDLVERTRPGPFGPRAMELGEYLGCFIKGKLVAMAGERLRAGRFREISGVCTDPAHRGQGFAHALVNALVRRQLVRHETPLLHVRCENLNAIRLYEWMGFREYIQCSVCVVSYLGGAETC